MPFSSSSSSKEEEAMMARSPSNIDDDSSYIVTKGRRTKRQRVLQNSAPPAATTTTSSITTSAGSYTSTAEEEADMANCLILLAQGPKVQPKPTEMGKVDGGCGVNQKDITGRRGYVEPEPPTDDKVSFYMYECKTCSKRFPSFQALGGHRTSHRKPKPAGATASLTGWKKPIEEDFDLEISIAPSFPKPIDAAANDGSRDGAGGGGKPRVHECSICGSEFSSGQALGGHMRRHRPVSIPIVRSSREPPKEKKSLLSLDLNLPAPSEEDHDKDFAKSPSSSSAATFTFGTGKPSVLFSALVDYHYRER